MEVPKNGKKQRKAGGDETDARDSAQEQAALLADCTSQLARARQELESERSARSHAEKDQGQLDQLRQEAAKQKALAENLGAELETLSYAISHDLRAPLRHLIGFSNALLEDYGEALEPTAQSYLDCVVRAGHRMESLVDALLALSRVGRQDMTILNLDLSQMAKSYAACVREGEPGRKVSFKIAEPLPARGDAVLLRTALEHLLENALKFSSKKDSATVEVGSKEEGGERVYFVRDDGAGFDLRFADRLFGPFQRMHRDEEFTGVGIGLAMVQRIINRHGGRIWAEAEVNAGATFYFTLGS